MLNTTDTDVFRRVTELGLRFPTLQDSPLRAGLEPARLDAWACEPRRDPRARHAVAFLLSVFSACPGQGLVELQRRLLRGLRDALEDGMTQLRSEGASEEELARAAETKNEVLRRYRAGNRQAARDGLSALPYDLQRHFVDALTYLQHEHTISEIELLRWYNTNVVYRVGAFDLVGALQVWDDAHRQVFLAWCHAPWFAWGPEREGSPTPPLHRYLGTAPQHDRLLAVVLQAFLETSAGLMVSLGELAATCDQSREAVSRSRAALVEEGWLRVVSHPEEHPRGLHYGGPALLRALASPELAAALEVPTEPAAALLRAASERCAARKRRQTTYVVRTGDTLSGIAAMFGWGSWRALYEAAENLDFRVLRPSPHKIFPGDELVIPEEHA